MAPSADLIDFEVIESHKENIQALPSGRSAKALANLYSPPSSTQRSILSPSPQDTGSLRAIKRQSFEEELTRSEEADDPLDIYDRYVKWTLDAYPSASATKESGLLQLLERATKTFLKNDDYKNDARYLKLWLLYIKLFCHGSDSAAKGPASREGEGARDTYIFLSRHGIGQNLALFYESFAEWLELKSRWQQAAEIWQLGIERQARPVERLSRKMNDFEQRRAARAPSSQGPSSPALPVVRPALGIRRDPFSTTNPEEADPQAADRERDRAARAAGTQRPGRRPKLEVFADSDENGAPKLAAVVGAGGWESIGGAHDRKKENTHEAQPWNGQKLDGGRKLGGLKMQVFKDPSRPESKLSLPSYCERQITVNPRTGKPECVFVNLDAVYDRNEQGSGEEFSFEELRARARGLLTKVWRSEPIPVRSEVWPSKEEKTSTRTKKAGKAIPIFVDENTMDARRLAEEVKRAKNELKKTEPQLTTIALNDENQVEDKENEEVLGPLPVDLAAKAARKAARKEEKANRTRKIRVMEVRAEPQTVQTNLSSPTTSKVKRKRTAEPTMTMCTKEAMEEIYDIFNQQPAQPDEEPTEEEQSEDSDEEDDDDDCTSVGESTGTAHLSCATSEAGDETLGGDFTVMATNTFDVDGTTGSVGPVTGDWTKFSEVKDIEEREETSASVDVTGVSWSDPTNTSGTEKHTVEVLDGVDEVTTPTSPLPTHLANRFVPIPPENCENAPTLPYRSHFQAANSRLPFMTPIVEKTESSIGAATALAKMSEHNHQIITKTPCRQGSKAEPLVIEDDDGPWSSPFDEVTKEAAEFDDVEVRLPQPNLPKPANNASTEPADITSILACQSQAPKTTSKKTVVTKEIANKGPVIQDTQCNPMDAFVRLQIMEAAHIISFDGYHDHRETVSGRGPDMRRYAKSTTKQGKLPSEKAAQTSFAAPELSFVGVDHTYILKRELGQGAFAPVYLVERKQRTDSEDETKDDAPAQMGKGAYGRQRSSLEAIKMEDPPTAWEFFIMSLARRRLGVGRAADSVVQAYEMHLFKDECFLIEEYHDQGTLLNIVNIARADSVAGGYMDELIVMFYTVELLRTVEALHSKGVLHGDLKADNILVRFPTSPTNLSSSLSDASWSSQYQRDGSSGWAERGISLIDFGRGIDMRSFKADVQFIADWKTSEADCAEMREMRPWTYQIDYHGLAGTIHSLLFGKYIETVAERGAILGAGATKTYKLREGLKRYWQTDIWTECFDLLLNPLAHVAREEGGKMPLVQGMKGVREKMEAFLVNNCEKGVGLKGLLRKTEASVKEKRR